ncbi:MAG TPA: hypothetical protein VMJ10_14420 [Kofleriaceae bacterium]|nr:hypothetical protein [Kofleriaceae bacterium]
MRWALPIVLVACRYYGSTTPAAAPAVQPQPSPYASQVELGSIAGVHTFSSDNALGAPPPPARDSLRDSALFGARLGWYFAGHFGVEAQLAVVPTEARATVYDVWTVLAEARAVCAPFGNVVDRPVPFLFAGGTLYDVLSSGGQPGTGIGSGSLVAPDVGVGIKDPFGNGWGLRADASVLFPSAVGGGVTEDFELVLSIYRSYGAAP